jgi:spermidine synthase
MHVMPRGRTASNPVPSLVPRILIDSADVAGGGGNLRLFSRGSEFSIMLGSNELMNSRKSGSEEALATLACDHILPRPRARLLIGGLGMGFTLRAALSALGSDAKVDVAELVPAVVAWARGPMATVHGDSLSDPRVAIIEADVASLIGAPDARYDAILLDVDNGPDGLTHPMNDRLYDEAGLRAAKRALAPGGVLAIWSAAPDERFTSRLRGVGFAVCVEEVRAHRGRNGARHTIWLATKGVS